MGFIEAVCTNCGGSLNVDDSREFGYCPYCGTQYFTEKIINNTYVTNNYTVNMHGPEIDNYIKVIAESLDNGNCEDADQYMKTAWPLAPDDIRLMELKIEIFLEKIKKEIAHSYIPIGNKICAGDTTQELPLIDLMKFYNDCSGYFELISEDVDLATDILLHTFNMLIQFEHQFYMVYKALIHNSIQKWTGEKGEFNGIQKNKAAYIHESCVCAIICIVSNSYATDSVVDTMIQRLIEDMDESDDPLYFLKCNETVGVLGKSSFFPGLKVRNKNGKEIKPLIGNYLLYAIEQNHPGYNAESYRKLKAIIEEKNKNFGSGCYVATCVYGSYDCPQVWTLRRFRDYTLATSWYGKAFVRFYYATSPTLVSLLGDMSWFKVMAKMPLDKLVSKLNTDGVPDTPYSDRQW